MIYVELLTVALVVVYVVDISGFTQSWKSALAKWLKTKAVRPMPPFDCGKCMTFWVCVLYALCTGNLSLWTVAFSSLLSLLSVPMGQILLLIREGLNALISKLITKC